MKNTKRTNGIEVIKQKGEQEGEYDDGKDENDGKDKENEQV